MNSFEKNIEELKKTLGGLKNFQESTQVSFNEAMDLAKNSDDIKNLKDKTVRPWLIDSLEAAKNGNLTADQFHQQIKNMGYGS